MLRFLTMVSMMVMAGFPALSARADDSKVYSCAGSSFFGGDLQLTLTFKKTALFDFIESAATQEADGGGYHGANTKYRGWIKSGCHFEGLHGEADFEIPCLDASDNSLLNPFGDVSYLGFKDWSGSQFSQLPAALQIRIDSFFGSVTNRGSEALELSCKVATP